MSDTTAPITLDEMQQVAMYWRTKYKKLYEQIHGSGSYMTWITAMTDEELDMDIKATTPIERIGRED